MYFFKRKPLVPESRHEFWRKVADLMDLSVQERLRIERMVFYCTEGKENASLTAQHLGISRKTLHKWLKRFKDSQYDVPSLADQSRAAQQGIGK